MKNKNINKVKEPKFIIKHGMIMFICEGTQKVSDLDLSIDCNNSYLMSSSYYIGRHYVLCSDKGYYTGKTYIIQGSKFAVFDKDINKAKKYKFSKKAENSANALNRKCANCHDSFGGSGIFVEEVREDGIYSSIENPSLKFDEIKANMQVWDNLLKKYIRVYGTVILEDMLYMKKWIYVNEAKRFITWFEENRFYRNRVIDNVDLY